MDSLIRPKKVWILDTCYFFGPLRFLCLCDFSPKITIFPQESAEVRPDHEGGADDCEAAPGED
jgi:hypothetical protein